MSGSSLSADQARNKLYRIMKSNEPFARKAEQALTLGEQYLGVDNGHLTQIDHAPNQGWADDPAYAEHEFNTDHGTAWWSTMSPMGRSVSSRWCPIRNQQHQYTVTGFVFGLQYLCSELASRRAETN